MLTRPGQALRLFQPGRNGGRPSPSSDTAAAAGGLGEPVPFGTVPRHHRVADGAVIVDTEECRDGVDPEGVRDGVWSRLAQRRDLLTMTIGVGPDLRGRVLAHRDDAHTGLGQRLHLGRGHLADGARGLEEGQHDGTLPPRVGDGFAGRRVG